MRYFTPELVLGLNSSDENVVDEAAEQWEKAILAYRRHLEAVGREMPVQTQSITKLLVHDWKLTELLDDHSQTSHSLVLILENEGEFVVINYLLTGKLRLSNAPKQWPVLSDPVNWLYDELDVDADNHKSFVHRILFSDGSTLAVPFSQCRVMPVKSGRAVSHSDLMQVA